MSSKRFVNRKEELKQLEGLFEETKKGTARFVFVSGEAGVGKAMLVEQFIEGRENTFTHFATTDQKNRPYVPYLALIEHLEEASQGSEPGEEASQGSEPGEEASDDVDATALITELRELFGKKTKSVGRVKEEQEMIFDKFIKLLDTVARKQPHIIFIDNLHLVDEASIQLTKHLALNLNSAKLMFVATYEPGEIEDSGDEGMHPVTELLAELMMMDKLRTIQVERFDEVSTSELISVVLGVQVVPPDLLKFIMEETEGSPMFISEMLKTILDIPGINLNKPDWFGIVDTERIKMPGGIQEAITRRIRAVDPECQTILGCAAVLGNEFRISDLSKLAKTEKASLSRIMSGLIEKRLIYELYDREEETYHFDHSKIREVLYNEVPPKKRMGLHGQAGQLLIEKGSEDYYSLAYHFTAAGDVDKGVAFSVLAGDMALASHAPNEAYRLYAGASSLIGRSKADDGNRRKHVDILNKMGELDYIIGEWDRGISCHKKAHRIAAELDDKRAIVESLALLGEILKFKGDNTRALKAFEEVVSISQQEGFDDGLASGHKGIGYIKWRSGDFDEAIYHYELCINSASLNVDMRTLGVAHIEMGNALSAKGDLPESQAHYRDAIAILEDMEEFSELARAHNNLGDTYLQLHDWDSAIENFRISGEIAEKIGYSDMIAWSQFNSAEAYSKKGDLDMALNFCNMALPRLQNLGDKVGLSGLYKNLGIIYRFKENWSESERNFNLGEELDMELNTPLQLIESYIEKGLMFRDKGDKDKSKTVLDEALALSKKLDAREYVKRTEEALKTL